ncbi:uncharacterized protein PG986_011786 [Apiospora aurea]|uniref:Uncharacterized protein n=1 Tax=Apiospora aurea TaxID=335848 RepID=A0ABR1PY38_9PEZI
MSLIPDDRDLGAPSRLSLPRHARADTMNPDWQLWSHAYFWSARSFHQMEPMEHMAASLPDIFADTSSTIQRRHLSVARQKEDSQGVYCLRLRKKVYLWHRDAEGGVCLEAGYASQEAGLELDRTIGEGVKGGAAAGAVRVQKEVNRPILKLDAKYSVVAKRVFVVCGKWFGFL